MSAYIYMTHTHECIHIHDTHTHDYNSRDHQAAQNQQRKGAKPSPSRRGPSFPAVAVIVTSTEECRLTCVTSVGVYARACCAGVGSCLRHSIDLNGASRRRRLGTDRLEHQGLGFRPAQHCKATFRIGEALQRGPARYQLDATLDSRPPCFRSAAHACAADFRVFRFTSNPKR
jgi:hypothetical protein